MRAARSNYWLDLLRTAYDVPDTVKPRNIEPAIAAALAEACVDHLAEQAPQPLPPDERPAFALPVREKAPRIVRVVRGLGDAGLLDDLLVPLFPVRLTQRSLAEAIVRLAGLTDQQDAIDPQAYALADMVLSKLKPAELFSPDDDPDQTATPLALPVAGAQ